LGEFGYDVGMISSGTVTTVAQARDDLSRVLRRFRGGDFEPLVLGSHRRPEAVIVPYEAYIAARTASATPALAAPTLAASALAAPTLDDLRQRRRLILRLAEMANLETVRVTGSVARGEATSDSDIDMIVDPKPGASLLDLAQFADDLEQLLGRSVDVLSARALDPDTDARLIADAVEL